MNLWSNPDSNLALNFQNPPRIFTFFIIIIIIITIALFFNLRGLDERVRSEFIGEDPFGYWGVSTDVEVELDWVFEIWGLGFGEDKGAPAFLKFPFNTGKKKKKNKISN